MSRHVRIKGKEVWFIERERYFDFISEHEIILIPRNNYPVQVKRFTDAVKVTTLQPEWKYVPLKRTIDRSISDEYLNPRGYFKEVYIYENEKEKTKRRRFRGS